MPGEQFHQIGFVEVRKKLLLSATKFNHNNASVKKCESAKFSFGFERLDTQRKNKQANK